MHSLESVWLIRLVSEHFNQADHSINDVLLIPLELIRSNRDSVRKVRKAHLIDKAMTLESPYVTKKYVYDIMKVQESMFRNLFESMLTSTQVHHHETRLASQYRPHN